MEKKWNLQDIRPSGDGRKKTSKSIPAASASKKNESRSTPSRTTAPTKNTTRSARTRSTQKNGRKKQILVGGIALCILAAGIGLTMLLGDATLSVQPKTKTVNVDARFTAYTEPEAGTLGYEVLTLEANAERQVTATGREEATERAMGTITIYNEYSEDSQRLITNTRFESPDGLVFRVRDSVEVPGYTTDANGNTVPGSIQAEVFADDTGEAHNITPTRFTLPGLEGSEQYDSIYAESDSAFTGGFEGERYILDEDELSAARASLHEELRNALRTRLQSERPAGFVLYDDAITFTFNTQQATESGTETATITERGQLQVPIFDELELATFIAENTVVGYESESVLMRDPYALTFAYTSTTTPSDLTGTNSLAFALRGDATLVWQFDEVQLREDLAGATKSALPTILSGYGAIERAEASIKPFWENSFPDSPDDITIEILLPATQ